MTVLKIPAGATYSFGFTWMKVALDPDTGEPLKNPDGSYQLDGPHDLTGVTARFQVRKKAGEEPLVTATSENAFDENGEIIDEVVAAGGGRVILQGTVADPKPGHIRVRLTDADTRLLAPLKSGGIFALEVTWPRQPDEITPEVDRPLEGTVEVDLNDVTP